MTTAAEKQPAPLVRANPTEFVLAVLGFIVLILALPIVLLMGGPIGGWAIGAALFAASWGAQIFISRVTEDMDPTHAVGLSGIASIGRAIVVVMLLFVVALRVDETIGLVAGAVFAVAFTFDLMGRTTLYSIKEKQRRIGRGEGVE